MSENNAMTEGAASEEAITVKTEKCKHCNGTGFMTVPAQFPDELDEFDWVDCYECDYWENWEINHPKPELTKGELRELLVRNGKYAR